MSLNSFGAATQLKVGDKSYKIYDLKAVSGIEKLPYSLKILAENLLRNEDGENITKEQIAQIANWNPDAQPSQEIQYSPARVLMQDFTGVPCVVDLATMRDAVVKLGKDPDLINPQVPAEMVIDHSVQIDVFGSKDAVEKKHGHRISTQPGTLPISALGTGRV